MGYEILDEAKKYLLAIGYTIHPFANLQEKAVRLPKSFVKLIQENLSKKEIID
jgi:acyl-CoA thioesterase FadM